MRSSSLLRARHGSFFFASVVLSLVTLFLALLVLEGVTVQNGPHNVEGQGVEPEPEPFASLRPCQGYLDICCRLAHTRTVIQHLPIDLPLGAESSNQPLLAAQPLWSSSFYLAYTMNVLRTVLAFAASAWCSPPTNQPSSCKASPSWPGFPGIKNIFSFGDSYTTTNFNLDGQQPTEGNPLGNPEYPGQTSAWPAANWIDFLTTKYNQSLILTYNIAVGGATVDRSLEDHDVFGRLTKLLGQVKGQTVFDGPPNLVEQVRARFAPRYNQKDGTTPLARPWNGNDTLFAFWFGVNDINGSYQRGKKLTGPLNRKIMESYSRVLRYLFDEHGMRNAVVMNVPAIDRSPWTQRFGKENQKLEKADLAEFNGLILDMVQDFKAYDVDDQANIWVYDSNMDFDKAMSKPKTFSQTSSLKNTTEACPLYGPIGTPENDTFIEECGVPVNQYFWLNDLHPTYPIHEAVAAQIVKLLESGPNAC